MQAVGCFLVSLFFAGNPYDNFQHLVLELYLCLDQGRDSTHEHMVKELRRECTTFTTLIFLSLKEVVNKKVAILVLYETQIVLSRCINCIRVWR